MIHFLIIFFRIHAMNSKAYFFNNDRNEIQTEDVKIKLNERSDSKNVKKSKCCCYIGSDSRGTDKPLSPIKAIKILVLGKFFFFFKTSLKCHLFRF